MAHHKKKTTEQQPDKMDQLINLVTWLATEMKTIKQDVDNLKNQSIKPEALKPDEIIEPDKSSIWQVQRETPYKVIPIEKIVRDESYVNIKDAPNWWIKKIYMWIWRTFKNKADATAYLDRMKKSNPGQQFDIFPV